MNKTNARNKTTTSVTLTILLVALVKIVQSLRQLSSMKVFEFSDTIKTTLRSSTLPSIETEVDFGRSSIGIGGGRSFTLNEIDDEGAAS